MRLVPVPGAFREEVELAGQNREAGRLALLAYEAEGMPWEAEGLSLVARHQSNLRAPRAQRIILFTGHRIDDPGRAKPRFPADKEAVARQAIKHAVMREKDLGGAVHGLAGAASGGDILFHEVCAELGIPTNIYLALPADAYIAASVASSGPEWVRRFHELHSTHTSVPVLSDTEKLPEWLSTKPDYSIWQRNNLWLLYEALAAGPENVTLIALWNGQTGDGPGGTEHMTGIARERGARVEILDTKELFGIR